MTDTKRVDGSGGPYVDADSTDPSKLICTLQLYPPNPFNPYTDNTGVHLILLAPGDSHDEVVTLNWPVAAHAASLLPNDSKAAHPREIH